MIIVWNYKEVLYFERGWKSQIIIAMSKYTFFVLQLQEPWLYVKHHIKNDLEHYFDVKECSTVEIAILRTRI